VSRSAAPPARSRPPARSQPSGSRRAALAGAVAATRGGSGGGGSAGRHVALAAAARHHRRAAARKAASRPLATARTPRTPSGRPEPRVTPSRPSRPSGRGPYRGGVSARRAHGTRTAAPGGRPSVRPNLRAGARAVRKATGGAGGHPFKSVAQWRFAFATHKSWAHKWAHRTMAERGGVKVAYHSLPPRVGRPTGRTAR
jgi:hypothetical protein